MAEPAEESISTTHDINTIDGIVAQLLDIAAQQSNDEKAEMVLDKIKYLFAVIPVDCKWLGIKVDIKHPFPYIQVQLREDITRECTFSFGHCPN